MIVFFSKKKFEIKFNIFIWILLLFYFYILIRSSISNYPLLSLEASLFYLRFIFLAMALSFVLSSFNFFKKYFFYSFFIFYSFVIISFFYYLIFSFFFSNEFYSENLQYSGVLKDEKILGGIIVRFIPIFTYLIYVNNFFTKKNEIFLSIFYFIILIIILFTGERSALFMYIIFIIAFIICFRKINIFKISLITLTVGSLLISFLTNNKLKERIIDETYNTVFGKVELSEKYQKDFYYLSFQHEIYYKNAFNIFKSNIFFGVGPKLYQIYCKDEKFKTHHDDALNCSTHPHNYYFQIMAETGLVGLFFIVILYLFCFYKFLNLIILSGNSPQIMFYVGLLIILFPFLPSGNIFGSNISVFIYLFIGFIINEYFKKNE